MALVSLLSVAPLGAVVHGLHHGLLFAGVAAVPVLAGAPWLSARLGRTRGEEDLRIAALRAASADGAVGTGASLERPWATPAAPTYAGGAATLLPLAVTASIAAATVHAAATVTHASHGATVAGFFLLSTVVQVGWALVAVTGAGRRVWTVGAAVNAAVVLVWLATRTTGLPFGPAPIEDVGPWDVAASGWELVVVGCCVALLLRGGPQRPMWTWSGPARSWVIGCMLVLLALAVSGPPA
jgi:hypothetical protein